MMEGGRVSERVKMNILLASWVLLVAVGATAQSLVDSVYCSSRREISPCTCSNGYSARSLRAINIECNDLDGFHQVVTALKNRFDHQTEINLKICRSNLADLPQLSFSELGLYISKLTLNQDNISEFPDTVFTGLSEVELLSLADNELRVIPQHIFNLMPKLQTVDLNGANISAVLEKDFKSLELVVSVMLNDNNITILEQNSLPNSLKKLSLSRNLLTTLNQTIRGMSPLDWLLVSGNQLISLESELPQDDPNKLYYLNAANNLLHLPPSDLQRSPSLNNLQLQNNKITSLQGAISRCSSLTKLNLSNNRIEHLFQDDFKELKKLESLDISFNKLVSLNSSLHKLKVLKTLNLSHNSLPEFNLQEIFGLDQLFIVDLSHNSIMQLVGRTKNLVELQTKVQTLRLEFNQLETLSGTLMGLHSLKTLNLSHNSLQSISSEDFIGLDNLHTLDISHNQLTTLDETSKTVLPALHSLHASYNWVRSLKHDFHGLPRLCWADLTHNKIEDISVELVEKTQCQLHNVNSVLRVKLQGNGALCRPEVLDKLVQMETNNNTEFSGTPECFNSLSENVGQHPFFNRNSPRQ